MSIFASQTQQTLPIPFDLPHTITIRKLTGLEVEQAQRADAIAIASGGVRLWAARMKRIGEEGAKALADPLVGFDRITIIRSGLLAWSYPQAVKSALSTGDAIEDLDDEAADFIATAILRLTKPALFLTSEEGVAAAQGELSGAASAA